MGGGIHDVREAWPPHLPEPLLNRASLSPIPLELGDPSFPLGLGVPPPPRPPPCLLITLRLSLSLTSQSRDRGLGDGLITLLIAPQEEDEYMPKFLPGWGQGFPISDLSHAGGPQVERRALEGQRQPHPGCQSHPRDAPRQRGRGEGGADRWASRVPLGATPPQSHFPKSSSFEVPTSVERVSNQSC